LRCRSSHQRPHPETTSRPLVAPARPPHLPPPTSFSLPATGPTPSPSLIPLLLLSTRTATRTCVSNKFFAF
jgi:hypothetical protein